VLYYRQQLQWLGGMGIIVLAVAILPMLRIGGMQLYRAETPGPMKDAKLTPRITETAKALWLIYVGITVTCIFAYWLAGMKLFDAVGHAFSTVAIGGFSTHNDSLSFWNSPTIEAVAIVFMTVAGINFALHFTAWRRASAQPYFLDPELKVYASLLFAFSVLVSFALFLTGTYETLSGAFRYGTFQVISAMTTTGFTTAPFYTWGGSLPVILITLAFIGGCAGSTAGGMKVIRVILLYRQSVREILRLVHPHAVIPVKIGGQRTSDTVISAVWGFFFLYIANFAVMTILLTATGLDAETAYSTVGACITNLGPALGQAGPNYAELNDTAKVILSIAMLLGRLEVYTLLVLLTPAFWRGGGTGLPWTSQACSSWSARPVTAPCCASPWPGCWPRRTISNRRSPTSKPPRRWTALTRQPGRNSAACDRGTTTRTAPPGPGGEASRSRAGRGTSRLKGK